MGAEELANEVVHSQKVRRDGVALQNLALSITRTN